MSSDRPSEALKKKIIQALAFQNEGNLSAAAKIYSEVLQNDLKNTDASYLLGQLALAQKDHRRAIILFLQAISEKPNQFDYYNSLGLAYHEVKDFQNSITTYQKALSLNPNSTESLIGLGNAYKHGNALHLAMDCYKKAIAINPALPMAYNNLGTTFRAQGDLVKAVSCFRQALRLDPNYKKGLMNLGNALQKMGNLEEAVACYQHSLSLDADFTQAYLNLGLAYQAIGWVEKAIEAFRNVLDRQPQNGKALAYLFHQYQHACNWNKLEQLSKKLDRETSRSIKNGNTPSEPPFLNISRKIDPKMNYFVARLWSRNIQERVIESCYRK